MAANLKTYLEFIPKGFAQLSAGLRQVQTDIAKARREATDTTKALSGWGATAKQAADAVKAATTKRGPTTGWALMAQQADQAAAAAKRAAAEEVKAAKEAEAAVKKAALEKKRALAEAEKAANSFKQRLADIRQIAQDVYGTLGMLRNFAAGGLFGIVGGAALLGKYGLGATGVFEQTRLNLKTLLKDVQLTDRTLTELVKRGAQTPFEFLDLADATKQLLGYGEALDDILRRKDGLLDVLGDTAAVAGDSGLSIQERLRLTIRTYAGLRQGLIDRVQLGAIGISTEQLMEKGIKFDKSGALASSGRDAADALLEIFKERFGGGMAEQSRSLFGIWSTFKDNLAAGLRAIGDALAPEVKELLDFLNDLMNGITDDPQMLRAITEAVRELVAQLRPLLETGKGYLTSLVAHLKQNPRALADALLAAYNAAKLLLTIVVVLTGLQGLAGLATGILNTIQVVNLLRGALGAGSAAGAVAGAAGGTALIGSLAAVAGWLVILAGLFYIASTDSDRFKEAAERQAEKLRNLKDDYKKLYDKQLEVKGELETLERQSFPNGSQAADEHAKRVDALREQYDRLRKSINETAQAAQQNQLIEMNGQLVPLPSQSTNPRPGGTGWYQGMWLGGGQFKGSFDNSQYMDWMKAEQLYNYAISRGLLKEGDPNPYLPGSSTQTGWPGKSGSGGSGGVAAEVKAQSIQQQIEAAIAARVKDVVTSLGGYGKFGCVIKTRDAIAAFGGGTPEAAAFAKALLPTDSLTGNIDALAKNGKQTFTPQVGDIVALDRKDGANGKSGGHMGILLGFDASGRPIISGNKPGSQFSENVPIGLGQYTGQRGTFFFENPYTRAYDSMSSPQLSPAAQAVAAAQQKLDELERLGDILSPAEMAVAAQRVIDSLSDLYRDAVAAGADFRGFEESDALAQMVSASQHVTDALAQQAEDLRNAQLKEAFQKIAEAAKEAAKEAAEQAARLREARLATAGSERALQIALLQSAGNDRGAAWLDATGQRDEIIRVQRELQAEKDPLKREQLAAELNRLLETFVNFGSSLKQQAPEIASSVTNWVRDFLAYIKSLAEAAAVPSGQRSPAMNLLLQGKGQFDFSAGGSSSGGSGWTKCNQCDGNAWIPPGGGEAVLFPAGVDPNSSAGWGSTSGGFNKPAEQGSKAQQNKGQQMFGWAEMVGSGLELLAAYIRDGAKGLRQALGQLVQSALSQFGPIGSGIGAVLGALLGRKERPQTVKPEGDSMPVRFAQNTRYGLESNPASALYGGRPQVSDAGSRQGVLVRLALAAGFDQVIEAAVTRITARSNADWGLTNG